MSSDAAEKQSAAGWQRIQKLLPKRPSIFFNKKSKQRRPGRVRRPAYPVGYKYGYHDSFDGPPKFEHMHYWPLHGSPWDFGIVGSCRVKERHEREITRQVPLYRPAAAEASPVSRESTGGDSARARSAPGSRRRQSQSSFFRLPPEIRLMIYAESFGESDGFNPLKYKTRDETTFKAKPSRLAPLLTCRQMYHEALPALKGHLRHLKLVNNAALYLPWSMPIEDLAYVRSLELDHFFNMDPWVYYDASFSSNHRSVVHTWLGAWDVVANYMPNLRSLKFNGHLIDNYGTLIHAYAELELAVLQALAWVHGPAYQTPVRSRSAAVADYIIALREQDRKQQSGSRSEDKKPPSKLRRLHVTLFWPERTWIGPNERVATLLAADGCDVTVEHTPDEEEEEEDLPWGELASDSVREMYKKMDPIFLKSNRKLNFRSAEFDW